MTRLAIPDVDRLLAIRDATPPDRRHFFMELTAAGTRIENAGSRQWNTYGEVVAFRRFIAPQNPRRVIIVSSGVHLRRVGFTVRRIFGGTPIEFLYCAVPPPAERLNRLAWWTSPKDRQLVASEWIKLAGYRILRRSPRWAPVADAVSKIAGRFL